MLDQKSVFDEMVVKWAKSEKAQNRIFANRIYQSVSENMGGPLEYMALAKLQAIADDASFDLIVVDTPPDTHALGLSRPAQCFIGVYGSGRDDLAHQTLCACAKAWGWAPSSSWGTDDVWNCFSYRR